MTRILAGLALVLAVAACSDSDAPPANSDEWPRFALADGGVTLAMPHDPDRRTTENGTGEERIMEEIAACEHYAEGLGLCHFQGSVLSGPMLPRDMGTTEVERRNWAKFLIAGMVADQEGHKNVEEGAWSLGDESGYWLRVALPAAPPKRSVPVFTWMKVCPIGDRALILQFVGSQAAYGNSLLKPKQDKLREKFFSSVVVE